MWRKAFRIVVVALIGVLAPMNLSSAKVRLYQNGRLPTFEDYPVRNSEQKSGEIIGLGRSEERESTSRFKQRIRQAAKKGANYAGNYAIVGWSCGMICVGVAIVDVRTLKVYDAPFVGVSDACPPTFFPKERRLLYFRLDSRLLINRIITRIVGALFRCLANSLLEARG